MKRVRFGIAVGTALTALLVGAPVATAGQLNLVPILQISGQHSDNVFFASTGKVADTFFLVNPGVALDYGSKNFVGSLAYQVGFQRYRDFKARNNNVHRLDASMGFSLSRGWYIDAVDNLQVTSDPLAFDASGDRIQRDSFTYNRFTPGLSFNFPGHNVRASARYDRIDVDYKNLIDSKQNGFGLNMASKLGGRSTLSFDYFEFKRDFQRQDVAVGVVNYLGRRFGARLDRRFSPRFSLATYGGYEKRKFDLEPGTRNYDSFIYEVTATGEIPEVFSWNLGVSRRLNDLAIRGAYKVDRFVYDVRKSVAERLRLDFGGYLQRSKNSQIPEEANFKGFRLEGQYMAAKFLNLWLGYEYIDRYNGMNLENFTENRVNFGLTLSYGL